MQQKRRGPPPPPGAADVTTAAVEERLPGLAVPTGDALVLLQGTLGADAAGWGLVDLGVSRRAVMVGSLGLSGAANDSAERAAALVRTSTLLPPS